MDLKEGDVLKRFYGITTERGRETRLVGVTIRYSDVWSILIHKFC